jgi:hypothetical protein
MNETAVSISMTSAARPVRLVGLCALLGVLTACTTSGPPAPVEARTSASKPPTVSSTTTRPVATPPKPSDAPKVFALPEAAAAAEVPAPVPMEAVPLPPPGAATPIPAPAAAASFEDPALRAIVAQVDQAEAAGDLERARSGLERALKVDARNARIWLRLGELNLRAGDATQAAAAAQQALGLAGDDQELKRLATDLLRRAGGAPLVRG